MSVISSPDVSGRLVRRHPVLEEWVGAAFGAGIQRCIAPAEELRERVVRLRLLRLLMLRRAAGPGWTDLEEVARSLDALVAEPERRLADLRGARADRTEDVRDRERAAEDAVHERDLFGAGRPAGDRQVSQSDRRGDAQRRPRVRRPKRCRSAARTRSRPAADCRRTPGPSRRRPRARPRGAARSARTASAKAGLTSPSRPFAGCAARRSSSSARRGRTARWPTGAARLCRASCSLSVRSRAPRRRFSWSLPPACCSCFCLSSLPCGFFLVVLLVLLLLLLLLLLDAAHAQLVVPRGVRVAGPALRRPRERPWPRGRTASPGTASAPR